MNPSVLQVQDEKATFIRVELNLLKVWFLWLLNQHYPFTNN